MPQPSRITQQRNNQMAVVFTNHSPSTLRDWLFFLYPKGKKSVSIGFQTLDGWALLEPDANHGYVASHNTRLSRQGGLWMRGDIGETAARTDVKLARLMMGHRFWHVSTPRVWFYRLLLGVILASAVMILASDELKIVGAVVAFGLPFLVPSPCTPVGLKRYAERKNFVYPVLQATASAGDDALPPTAAALARR